MQKIDTFSTNSLKLLDKNKEEFINKYLYNLDIKKQDKRAILGQKFHSLICAYIKGFDISKIILELNENEIVFWQNLENFLKDKKENFIKTEYPFLIKEKLNDEFYYLTGRFDAIYKENDGLIIYDWKTLNLPKDIEGDLQSVVYLFCANKIFKTEKLKIKYLSIENQKTNEACFISDKFYKEKIEKVIMKLKTKSEDKN